MLGSTTLLRRRTSSRGCGSLAPASQYDTTPGRTEESALYGSAEEIVARLRELHAAGVTQVLINGGGEKPIESLRRFAKQVMPELAET